MTEKVSEQTIYVVSGPIGVGKSTTTKRLAQSIENCVLIEADHLLHMFQAEAKHTWEDRLQLTWVNIVALTRNFIQHDLNIVLDFVVEEEFEWFCNQISDLHSRLKYVVLRADEETLLSRLHKRGDDSHSITRSLFLKNKLEMSKANANYLLETTYKNTEEIVAEILKDSRFDVLL